jgi:KilA-N domain
MKNDTMTRSISGIEVSQRKDDGYVNATRLLKAHKVGTGETKKMADWLATERAKVYIDHLALKVGIPTFDLVQTKRGAGGGTWIHPRLSVRFAMWLSEDFALQVEDWIQEWMTTGKNPIAAPALTRAEIIATLLPAQPLTWQCRYTPVFWERLDALYAYKQGNIACAHWINRFVYGYFPQEIRDRLDEINPLIDGKRKRLQHTHFDGELLQALEQHLGIVFNFMLAAATASEFERLMDAKFRGIYQLQIWRAA